MGSFSIWHWLVVLLVVLLLFGGGKVSGLMGDFAKGIKAFKKNMAEDDDASMEARADKPAGSIAARRHAHAGDHRPARAGVPARALPSTRRVAKACLCRGRGAAPSPFFVYNSHPFAHLVAVGKFSTTFCVGRRFAVESGRPSPVQYLVLDMAGDHDMEWNEEAITRLRALWDEGLSTAEIGRRMNVSKNAVVGKAHRLGLVARPSPIRREAATSVSASAFPAPGRGSDAAAACPAGRRRRSLPPLPERPVVAAPVAPRLRAAPARASRLECLLLADRRAGHDELPLLRRRCAVGKAVLRRARPACLRESPRPARRSGRHQVVAQSDVLFMLRPSPDAAYRSVGTERNAQAGARAVPSRGRVAGTGRSCSQNGRPVRVGALPFRA